jgi:hypothetical protein
MLGIRPGHEFNAYIRDPAVRVREHYNSGVTTVIPISDK